MPLPVAAPVAFEKLQININSIDISKSQELPVHAVVPAVSVFHKMAVVSVPEYKELAGDINIVFRDNHTQDGEVLLLKGFFTVKADAADDTSDAFYTLLRYLFIYTKDYVTANNLQDKNGHSFIIPDCNFSTPQSGALVI